jgi:hypothetical protein
MKSGNYEAPDSAVMSSMLLISLFMSPTCTSFSEVFNISSYVTVKDKAPLTQNTTKYIVYFFIFKALNNAF